MFLRLWPSEKLIYLPFETERLQFLQHSTSSNSHREKRSDDDDNDAMASVSSLAGGSTTPKSLAGPGYVILNTIRVMNVIALLAVITASVVMLVKTTIDSNFFFFDAVSHVMTAVTGMFLCISELSLFRAYYARNWPLLSPARGFVTLAIAMIVLGVNMLGNLNKPATSEAALGLAFWRIVIASGIVVFIMGFVNLVANYVFRDRKQGITARQVRAHGAVAVHKTPRPSHPGTPPAPTLASSILSGHPITPPKPSSPFRFQMQERRQSLLPSYHSASFGNGAPPREPGSPTSRYSRATACTKKKVFSMIGRNRQSLGPQLPVNVHNTAEPEISPPLGVNPQFAHLVARPDSAMHPSRNNESQAFRWRI